MKNQHLIIYCLIAYVLAMVGCAGAPKGEEKDLGASSVKKTEIVETSEGKVEQKEKIVMSEKDSVAEDDVKKETRQVFNVRDTVHGKYSRNSNIQFRQPDGTYIGRYLSSFNPYLDLPYNIRYMSKDSVNFSWNLSSLSYKEKMDLLRPMRINKDANWADSTYLGAYCKTPIWHTVHGITVIGYNINYFCNEEDIIATSGCTLVLDSLGNVIKTIEDKKDGFYSMGISKDGKYLMQKYGIDYGEDGGGQLDRGFKFYDIATGEMVYELEFGKDRFITGFNLKNNILEVTRKGRVAEKILIDYRNERFFMKKMTRKSYSQHHLEKKSFYPKYNSSHDLNDLIKDGFKLFNSKQYVQ